MCSGRACALGRALGVHVHLRMHGLHLGDGAQILEVAEVLGVPIKDVEPPQDQLVSISRTFIRAHLHLAVLHDRAVQEPHAHEARVGVLNGRAIQELRIPHDKRHGLHRTLRGLQAVAVDAVGHEHVERDVGLTHGLHREDGVQRHLEAVPDVSADLHTAAALHHGEGVDHGVGDLLEPGPLADAQELVALPRLDERDAAALQVLGRHAVQQAAVHEGRHGLKVVVVQRSESLLRAVGMADPEGAKAAAMPAVIANQLSGVVDELTTRLLRRHAIHGADVDRHLQDARGFQQLRHALVVLGELLGLVLGLRDDVQIRVQIREVPARGVSPDAHVVVALGVSHQARHLAVALAEPDAPVAPADKQLAPLAHELDAEPAAEAVALRVRVQPVALVPVAVHADRVFLFTSREEANDVLRELVQRAALFHSVCRHLFSPYGGTGRRIPGGLLARPQVDWVAYVHRIRTRTSPSGTRRTRIYTIVPTFCQVRQNKV